MLRYPATLTPANGGFCASFRDIPEAHAQAGTSEEALCRAEAALWQALDDYREALRPVPAPSAAQPGEVLVALPASISAKVLLLNELVKQGISQAELARRMGVEPQEVTRILNMQHRTKVDTVARALKCLGRTLTVVMV